MECKADDKLAAQMLSESYHGYWMPLPAILALRAQFSRFGVGPVDMLTGSENQPKHMLRPIRPRRVTRKEKEVSRLLCFVQSASAFRHTSGWIRFWPPLLFIRVQIELYIRFASQSA